MVSVPCSLCVQGQRLHGDRPRCAVLDGGHVPVLGHAVGDAHQALRLPAAVVRSRRRCCSPFRDADVVDGPARRVVALVGHVLEAHLDLLARRRPTGRPGRGPTGGGGALGVVAARAGVAVAVVGAVGVGIGAVLASSAWPRSCRRRSRLRHSRSQSRPRCRTRSSSRAWLCSAGQIEVSGSGSYRRCRGGCCTRSAGRSAAWSSSSGVRRRPGNRPRYRPGPRTSADIIARRTGATALNCGWRDSVIRRRSTCDRRAPSTS